MLLVGVVLPALLCLLAVAHHYLARRLVLDPGLASPWRELALLGIAVGGVSLVAQPIGERLLRRRSARWIAWPASLWMGLAFLMLLLLGFSEALLALGVGVARASGYEAARWESAPAWRAACVVFSALAAGTVGFARAWRPPRLRRIEIPLARWPEALDGFRIVQLSDIHIGPLLERRFAEGLVARVNALEPDLVALTGDLVDGSVHALRDEVAPFAGLRAKHGVYFVTGNHDHMSGARSWSEFIHGLGIDVLRNERRTIPARPGAEFELAGVDDHRGSLLGREGGEDLDRALAGWSGATPLVLLAHDPNTFVAAARRGIDLQISGHTHGGQIWPFHYLVLASSPFLAGLYRRGAAQLYVSRGTGFWGPPLRIRADAEITEIVLRRAPESSAPTGAGALGGS